MRALCLDLASRVGFAVGGPLCGVVAHGSVQLPKTGEDVGKFLAHFRQWLGQAIERYGPTEIMFEMPILPETTALATARKLYSLCGITELVALDYRIPIREANLSNIRMHFIGCARAPKEIRIKEIRRRWLKDRTVAECRSRGFKVADDDEADALAVLSFAISLVDKGYDMRAAAARAAA